MRSSEYFYLQRTVHCIYLLILEHKYFNKTNILNLEYLCKWNETQNTKDYGNLINFTELGSMFLQRRYVIYKNVLKIQV